MESLKEGSVVVLVLTFTECNLCQYSGKGKACVLTENPSALQEFFFLQDVFLQTGTVSVLPSLRLYIAMLTKIANLKLAATNAAF